MTHRARFLGWLAALGALTGCGSTLVPFSHEIRARHNLSAEEVQQLQFYVSNDVKLRREAHTVGRDISDGNLKLREGKTIEEVVINEATPGVAVGVDTSSIVISFEEGSELRFSIRDGETLPVETQPLYIERNGFAEPPNPFPGTDMHEAPSPIDELLGNYWLDADSDSMVSFRGRAWNGMEETFRAHLLIDAESLEEVVETRTELSGRTLGDSGRRIIFVH